MRSDYAELLRCTPAEIRARIRSGAFRGQTAGLAPGYLQANLVILPERYALDFMRFCQRNPKPCPLVGVSETGEPAIQTLGAQIDVRTDLPAYNVYRFGQLEACVPDIRDLWTADMVAFALGCSFTFEHALQRAGIRLKHIECGTTVPMFRTTIETVPAGPFGGPMVVSMRGIRADQVETAIAISRRFPLAHGAPVHIGDPAKIGIADLMRPDWGDPTPLDRDEIPVFWACGVTPQVAVEAACLPLCITHKPGHMLITDVPEDAEVPIVLHTASANKTL